MRSSSFFFTLFDIKLTCDGSKIYSTKKRRKRKEIGHFSTCCFLKRKIFANAITFIVVYIFNTGRLEIVSFNV